MPDASPTDPYVQNSRIRFPLKSSHTSTPRVITVDKNRAYPAAIKELKEEGFLPEACDVRQIKYLNNTSALSLMAFLLVAFQALLVTLSLVLFNSGEARFNPKKQSNVLENFLEPKVLPGLY